MKITYTINENNSVCIYNEGILVNTYSKEDIIENALQYYEAAGFSPAKAMIDSMDYESLIENTIIINYK